MTPPRRPLLLDKYRAVVALHLKKNGAMTARRLVWDTGLSAGQVRRALAAMIEDKVVVRSCHWTDQFAHTYRYRLS